MAVVTNPSADVHMLLGQAHFQLDEYKQAVSPIRTAIDKYRGQGKKPKENWLLLLRVIYFERNDFDNMLAVVKELLVYYPKDTYVLTLAGIYSERGDTKKQLVLTEVLYEKAMPSMILAWWVRLFSWPAGRWSAGRLDYRLGRSRCLRP